MWPKGVKRPNKNSKLADVKAGAVAEPKADEQKPTEPKVEQKAKSWTKSAGNDWRIDAGFVSRIRGKKDDPWEDTTNEDRFAIAPEVIEGLRQNGVVLTWVTHECLGRTESQHISHFLRGGWQYVQPGDIEGINTVEIEGMKLMARPLELHKKALKHQQQLARGPIQAREEMLNGPGGGGVPLASGAGSHHRAKETNFIRRSMEQIEVPRDD